MFYLSFDLRGFPGRQYKWNPMYYNYWFFVSKKQRKKEMN